MADLTLNKPSALSMVQRSLAKRAAGQLTAVRQAQAQQAERKALLLDISSSMSESTENRAETRIDALRKLVADMDLKSGQDVYAFSYEAQRCDPRRIPNPNGATYLGKAFQALKRDGHKSVVLITDGHPSDPEEALEEAKGLRLEVFYVGPAPQPRFLSKLAKSAGGSAKSVTMNKELAATVRALLA